MAIQKICQGSAGAWRGPVISLQEFSRLICRLPVWFRNVYRVIQTAFIPLLGHRKLICQLNTSFPTTQPPHFSFSFNPNGASTIGTILDVLKGTAKTPRTCRYRNWSKLKQFRRNISMPPRRSSMSTAQ